MSHREMILDSLRELGLTRAEVMCDLWQANEAGNANAVACCEATLASIGHMGTALANELAKLPAPDHTIARNRYWNEDLTATEEGE